MSNTQANVRSSRSLAIILGALLVLALVAVPLVVLPAGGQAGISPGSLGVMTALVAAALAARTALLRRGAMRFSWSMLGLYLGIYAVGDALYSGLLGGSPQPSLADIVYLIAFVPAGLGLLCYPILELSRGMWRPLLIDAALLVASVALVVHTLVLRHVHGAGLELVTVTILSIYPLISTWCAALMVLVLARSRGGQRPDATLMGLAYVVYAWGDNGYAFLSVSGADLAGTWVDACYTLAPLLLAAAAAVAAATPTPRRELRRHLSGSFTPVLADLFGLGALALAAVVGPRDVVSAALGLLTVVILSVRQVALTSASWKLRGALERRIDERTQELRELTAHYERLDARKREFITATSHELRTPLAAIRGGLEMLQDGDAGELNPTAQRIVTIASRGSERLSRLVDDIIDLEKLDSGAFAHDPSVQPVERLVTEAVQTLAPLAAQHAVELRIDLAEASVVCEPDPIVQVLVNLLGNALKFSDGGTQVVVRARRQAEEVVVSVRDQGRGIPSDQLETIFRRFHQIEKDDSREKGGAGLGLSISQLIVHQHGGRMWAESDGDGATFWFTLPAADSPTPATARPRG
ncbi:sensor histidine kinase [Nocardioides daphniae]|uniref:histidine kinase n=1 Tax=Nocardioides daphniae TaxID=402297 RepID=A0A4P7UC71_9ACTN|nr:ATP-binding protein [Nocardioides daphniae]QCC77354.1 hypothetical protein E2C04_09470 [Nocardioides daphniae]